MPPPAGCMCTARAEEDVPPQLNPASVMQRIREQIRAWANDATIRDTTLLLEARRAIEHQMVRTLEYAGWRALSLAVPALITTMVIEQLHDW